MKKIIMIIIGFIPFIIGGILNYIMLKVPTVLPPLLLIGILFLLLWGFGANRLRFHSKNPLTVMVCMNAPAGIVLILLGIQEILLGQYFSNAVGLWTQYFYLPLLSIGYQLTFWSPSVFAAYCASFLLMIVATFIGCRVRYRKNSKKDELHSSA